MTEPDDTEAHRSAVDSAEAATTASQDAVAASQAAADTVARADEASTEVEAVHEKARRATAAVVAAAAVTAADTARRTAETVSAAAATRARDVAATAAQASEAAAAAPNEPNAEELVSLAVAIAVAVAEDVVTQARLTKDTASTVANAVALAAEAAASAAVTAAALVETAARTAESSARLVEDSSAATHTASGITVGSTERAARLAVSQVARLRRAPMVAELQRALEEEELRLHFQTQHSMESGAIVGVEALLRWQHPTRGLLYPIDFLDVAEGPDLVAPIGDWVIRAAVAQAAEWERDFGDQAPLMWVNVSCDQLGRDHLASVVEHLFSESGLSPGLIGIEVTERHLARQVDNVANELTQIRELGVALAVDDFGTGYASLDYLRRFVFDQIKIDRSFVSGLQDRTNAAIIASIIALARALGLDVVAEGVETQEQFDRLRMLGCDLAQGYLLRRPAAAELVTASLRKQLQQFVAPEQSEPGPPDSHELRDASGAN